MKLTAKDLEDRDLVCCYCGKRDGITEAFDNGDNLFAIHCNDYATLIPFKEWDEEVTEALEADPYEPTAATWGGGGSSDDLPEGAY